MAAQRFRPYRSIPKSVMKVDSWKVAIMGQEVPAGTPLNWDYATPLNVSTTVWMDAVEALTASGLQSTGDLELVAMADCQQALWRRVVRLGQADFRRDSSWSVSIDVPEGQVSGDLDLRLYLVTASEDLARRSRGAAVQRGAIVWEGESVVVRLEGDGNRFPTEMVSFKELGPAMARQKEAPWRLRLEFDDEQDNVRASVRLLVNTDHPVSAVFADTRNPLFETVAGMIRADVVEGFIASLAMRGALTDPDPENPESVVAAAHDLTESALGMSLKDAIELYKESPTRMTAMVRHSLGFLGKLVS